MDAIDEALLSLDGLESLDATETLEHASEIQRNINLANAELLKVACHWADLNAVVDSPHATNLPGTEQLVEVGGDGTPEIAEFACAELAAQLQVTPTAAKMLIADSLDLRHRLPLLWHLVRLGDVKPWVARQVAVKARHLSREAAAVVDAKTARYATRLGWGRLEAVVDAAVIAADPEQAQQRADAARDRQGVFVGRRTESGYGSVFIRAAGVDVEAFDTTIDDIAQALDLLGDPDTIDVRRAKAVGIISSTQATLDLFTQAANRSAEAEASPDGPVPAEPRRRTATIGDAVVYLHLSDQAVGSARGLARVEEVGPALTSQVQEWLGHRNVIVKPVIDLNNTHPVDGYQAPDWLDEAVDLRSPAECFPWSTDTTTHSRPRRRSRGDTDHTRPYRPPDRGGPPGQTSLPRLGRLLRFHHRIKTHGHWKVIQLISGVWLWHSPHEYSYLVDNTGTTPLGRLFAPA